MTVAMVVLTLAAHVAAAESYGFSVVSSLRRAADVLLGRSLPAVPEPWASALSFAFLSATCWLLKPILARIVCERWLGLPERSTMTVRRWTDGVHVVLTPLVVLAIVFGSETSDFELMPMLALSWGAFVVTVIAFMAVDVCEPHFLISANAASADACFVPFQSGSGRSTPRAGSDRRPSARRRARSSASACRVAAVRRRRPQASRVSSQLRRHDGRLPSHDVVHP
jgi:hypothetical protein